MKNFKTIILIIFIFISNAYKLNAFDLKQLKLENVKDFKTVDWNNDGKQDMLVYFNDGRFGILINNSNNENEISFAPIKFMNAHSSDSIIIKQSPAEINKPVNPEKKIKTAVQSKKEDITKIDTSVIFNMSSLAIYDACVLNFVNESDISRASEFEWMKTGIPDLLIFELENDTFIKTMPREQSIGLRPGNPKINSRIIISGSYKILPNDIILTVLINDGKKIKQLKFSGANDTTGVLTTISTASIDIKKEISQLLK